MKLKINPRAFLLACLAVFFWATAATAFKITLRYTNFINMLLLSSLFSTLVIWSVILITNKIHKLRSASLKEIINSMLLGALNPFFYYLFVLKAYSLLPAQLAQPLNFIWPLMIVLLSVLILKEKVTLINILALLVSFSGVIVLSTRGSFISFQGASPLGIVLALSSSLIWAFYWILNLKNKLDPVVKLALNFVFGSIYILIFTIFTGRFENLTIPVLLGSAYIGFFEMGITFIIWLKALKLAEETTMITNLIYFTPFFALMFIAIILKEHIYPGTLIGVFLIVIGIMIQHNITKITPKSSVNNV